MNIQHATGRCDCGALIRYQPTRSPWEFSGRCLGKLQCQSVVSWAHHADPPAFGESQPSLFDEAGA